MAKPTYSLDWSDALKADLKKIYKPISEKSIQGVKNVINDILDAPNTAHFHEHHQIEEYYPECRRIVVRHYKILYIIDEPKKVLHIVRVFDMLQDPMKVKN